MVASFKLLLNELQYVISVNSPNTFLQLPNVFCRAGFSKSPNTFLQFSNVFRRTVFSKSPNTFLQISKIFHRLSSSTRLGLCSMEKTSLRSFPTCATGSALCVMGSRLWFLGHACSPYTCSGSVLDVMDYGLAEAMGVSSKLTARSLLILRINILWS